MKEKHIYIYGAGEAGLSTLNSLKNSIKSSNSYTSIFSFIDDDHNKQETFLDGFEILSIEKFKQNSKKKENKEVILSSEFISTNKKSQLLDFCNKHRITVKKVPLYEEWVTETEFDVKKIKQLQISDLLDREEITIDNSLIKENILNKTLLITGGAGSIGSQIVKAITKYNPKKIIVIDISETALHNLEMYIIDHKLFDIKKIFFRTIDIKDKIQLRHVFKKYNPEIIFHAAAFKHVPMMERNPLSAISSNIFGTHNLLELTAEFKTRKFVFISTDKAVNPTNIMGATKRYSENMVQYFNKQNNTTTYITTRFGNVLGSNGSVIPRFQYLIDNGFDLQVTHPDIVRYFMTIEESCNLVLEASSMGNNGEIFVFDMGKPCKISHLAKSMIKLNGLEPGIDVKIHYTGLREGEKLHEELLANSENTQGTYHPKILIAKPENNNNELFVTNLVILEKYIKNNQIDDAVKLLKKCIPEYKSQNSIYNMLD